MQRTEVKTRIFFTETSFFKTQVKKIKNAKARKYVEEDNYICSRCHANSSSLRINYIFKADHVTLYKCVSRIPVVL